MYKPRMGRTHPLIWCTAAICTVLAVAVIVTGITVMAGFMIIRPKVPYITVEDAHLNRVIYDQAGVLTTDLTILVRAKNDNKAHANFYNMVLVLSLNHGVEVAKLVTEPFEVGKNWYQDLKYELESTPIPLGPGEMEYVDMALKKDQITFGLRGYARTRWRAERLLSVRFWIDLDCELKFRVSNGTYKSPHSCTSSK